MKVRPVESDNSEQYQHAAAAPVMTVIMLMASNRKVMGKFLYRLIFVGLAGSLLELWRAAASECF